MNSGIYCFENLIDNKKYVGQSKHITKREQEHLYILKSKKKKDSIYFQNAYNKYNKKNFKFWIVEECAIELLDEREIFWIKELHSHVSENGYNISWGGNTPMKNLVHSEESKKLISENSVGMLGKHHSQETKDRLSKINKGKHLSEETKQKMSDYHKKLFEDNPNRFDGENNPSFGKRFSEERKKRISLSQLGKKRTNSTSKYCGVCLHTTNYVDGSPKWQCRLRVNGKLKRIGCFREEIDAAKAYNKYVIENNLPHPLNVFEIT